MMINFNSISTFKQKSRQFDQSPFRSFRRTVRKHSIDHRYWNPFVDAFKFIIHFVVVMLLLYCGALVFARLEDPEVMYRSEEHQLNETNDTNASTHTDTAGMEKLKCGSDCDKKNYDEFWKNLEVKYNSSVPLEFRDEVWDRLSKKEPEDDDDHGAPASAHVHHSSGTAKDEDMDEKEFVFMKWFYFTIVATTTIGYGHVYPKTDPGKLFYIFFSIIGIVLMMTLLRSCGKILMTVNKKFYRRVSRCLWRDNEPYLSDQFMSVVSLCFIFLGFMLLVVWHDKNIGEVDHWHWIDTFYFWLVTFTTVGFGDVHFPLKVEVQHFWELVVYRVFGLSFLAGIIESIHEYIKFRQIMLIKQNKQHLQKLSQILIGNATPIGLTANFLPGMRRKSFYERTGSWSKKDSADIKRNTVCRRWEKGKWESEFSQIIV